VASWEIHFQLRMLTRGVPAIDAALAMESSPALADLDYNSEISVSSDLTTDTLGGGFLASGTAGEALDASLRAFREACDEAGYRVGSMVEATVEPYPPC
jgi:hypothetical protein